MGRWELIAKIGELWSTYFQPAAGARTIACMLLSFIRVSFLLSCPAPASLFSASYKMSLEKKNVARGERMQVAWASLEMEMEMERWQDTFDD